MTTVLEKEFGLSTSIIEGTEDLRVIRDTMKFLKDGNKVGFLIDKGKDISAAKDKVEICELEFVSRIATKYPFENTMFETNIYSHTKEVLRTVFNRLGKELFSWGETIDTNKTEIILETPCRDELVNDFLARDTVKLDSRYVVSIEEDRFYGRRIEIDPGITIYPEINKYISVIVSEDFLHIVYEIITSDDEWSDKERLLIGLFVATAYDAVVMAEASRLNALTVLAERDTGETKYRELNFMLETFRKEVFTINVNMFGKEMEINALNLGKHGEPIIEEIVHTVEKNDYSLPLGKSIHPDLLSYLTSAMGHSSETHTIETSNRVLKMVDGHKLYISTVIEMAPPSPFFNLLGRFVGLRYAVLASVYGIGNTALYPEGKNVNRLDDVYVGLA